MRASVIAKLHGLSYGLALLLAVAALLLLLSGCACQSTYFRSCGRQTWEQMCKRDVACRTCLRDSPLRDREEAARRCWESVSGRVEPGTVP